MLVAGLEVFFSQVTGIKFVTCKLAVSYGRRFKLERACVMFVSCRWKIILRNMPCFSLNVAHEPFGEVKKFFPQLAQASLLTRYTNVYITKNFNLLGVM